MSNQTEEIPFNSSVIINAYQRGYFPMGMNDEGEIGWFRPDPRATIPLESFHISRRLERKMTSLDYEVRINTCFERVMRLCGDKREETWITEKMIQEYVKLHHLGVAHSLEIWCEDKLAGGLYGLSFGGAFFGESMMHILKDCSKIALCELVLRMRNRGMTLLDCQYTNKYLEQFRVVLINDEEYIRQLQEALSLPVCFVD